MRILNTKDAEKKYSRFSLPGFRSNSFIKKIIASLYYLSVIVLAVTSIRLMLSADFGSGNDVLLAVIVEIIIVLILITPVIAIGFSDHYDWHGIKLFLIIMVSWCVLFTVANFVSLFFSEEFINSTNTESAGTLSSGETAKDGKSDAKIDEAVIEDELKKQESDANK